ncbi:MAG: hypothetical protein WAM82_18780 [Thermoanaerobaculia bacterium]
MPSPQAFRLYLAAAPGDMDGERAVIEGLVLPELRLRLQGEGVEIITVDPANATGEKWDLARRFREIEGCQIFIGLLGERYGEAPRTVAPSLVAAQTWLAEDPERSVVELEVLQGALRQPERRASFFYFRNPRFPFMLPETMQGRFLPESDEAITRLERLKDRIRNSGRPVFDGYPCGWSEGLGRAARLDTFAEQVFQDLWEAIQERVRSAQDFDPNATIQAFHSPPSLDETRAALPPIPPTGAAAQPMMPSPVSEGRGARIGVRIVAVTVLAVIGLLLVRPTWRLIQRLTSNPVDRAVPSPSGTQNAGLHLAPPAQAVPVITPEAWNRLAAACRLNAGAARTLAARVPAGSPMVQVFASTDWINTGRALSRYSSRRGFLLPLEENSRAVCSVVLGPFPSKETASRAAAEIRMSDGADAKVVAFPSFTK